MIELKIDTCVFRINEGSSSLAAIQKYADTRKKKTPPPRIKKDKIREYPCIDQCEGTADYVRKYYALNSRVFFSHGSNAWETIVPDLFEPMHNAPVSFPSGIDGVEEPSDD